MIRFAQTDKWDDPWFSSLSKTEKLVFLYLIDKCDNAGFWEENTRLMSFHLGLNEEQCQGALKGLGRGLVGASGWYWVKNFLRHQKNECLNPDNPAHRQIIALVERQLERFPDASKSLPEGAYKGLLRPIGIGKGNGLGNGNRQKTEKVSENSPLMIRIGSWFKRKPDSLWSAKEAKALKEINPNEAQLDGMETFYTAEIPKKEDFRRRDLLTLLNNWNGELDKARRFINEQ